MDTLAGLATNHKGFEVAGSRSAFDRVITPACRPASIVGGLTRRHLTYYPSAEVATFHDCLKAPCRGLDTLTQASLHAGGHLSVACDFGAVSPASCLALLQLVVSRRSGTSDFQRTEKWSGVTGLLTGLPHAGGIAQARSVSHTA